MIEPFYSSFLLLLKERGGGHKQPDPVLFPQFITFYERKHWLFVLCNDVIVQFSALERKEFPPEQGSEKGTGDLASLHSWPCHQVDLGKWCKVRGKNQREKD